MIEFFPFLIENLFNPIHLAFMFFACVFGMFFGAIPGLNSTIAISLFLPITFGMKPELAIPFLFSFFVGSCTGAFISAVLVGIPGTSAAIATCFDGYPLAQKGQADKALGIGIVASFIGTFFSAIIGAFLCVPIARLALKLGPWEYFSLCFCAITLIIAISKENMFKGFASAGIGMLLSCTGFAPIDGYQRFTFGIVNISGGFSLVYIMLGLFAISRIIIEYAQGFKPLPPILKGKKLWGVGFSAKEFVDNIWNMIRSFFIGLWIGFLPGMGSGLSNMVAYGKAKSASKHPEKFGNGAIEGVFASETANNAAVGGATIPLVALGIPGDSATAILLGGIMIHGIEPGPLMMRNQPQLVYLIFGGIILSAIIVGILQLLGKPLLPQILKVPYHYLYPALIVMSFVSVFTVMRTTFDCGMLIFFALVGVLIKIGGLPTSPLLLTFILGEILELNLRKALIYSKTGVASFFTRPVSLILLCIAFASIVLPIYKIIKEKRGISSQKPDSEKFD